MIDMGDDAEVPDPRRIGERRIGEGADGTLLHVNSSKMRHVAVYVRISQDREGTGEGVERQRQDCEAAAEQLGWSVVTVYTDNDVSASTGKQRPQYEEMLKALERGTVNAVIAWHTDRLHRRNIELESFIDLCERRDIAVHIVRSGELNLSTPSGRMVARLLGATARHEVDQMKARIVRQKQAAAAKGLYRGSPRPFGYENGGMAVREAEAELIRNATHNVTAGVSLRSIVRQWTDAGVHTSLGRPFTVTGLRALLMRWRNAGIVEHKGGSSRTCSMARDRVRGRITCRPCRSEQQRTPDDDST
jgi:DNA invertase Pin-like site-specific DNA recombinase